MMWYKELNATSIEKRLIFNPISIIRKLSMLFDQWRWNDVNTIINVISYEKYRVNDSYKITAWVIIKTFKIEIKTIIAEFEHARMLKEKQRKNFLFSMVCKVICENKFSHQNNIIWRLLIQILCNVGNFGRSTDTTTTIVIYVYWWFLQIKMLVARRGIEPVTFALLARRSNQLS